MQPYSGKTVSMQPIGGDDLRNAELRRIATSGMSVPDKLAGWFNTVAGSEFQAPTIYQPPSEGQPGRLVQVQAGIADFGNPASIVKAMAAGKTVASAWNAASKAERTWTLKNAGLSKQAKTMVGEAWENLAEDAQIAMAKVLRSLPGSKAPTKSAMPSSAWRFGKPLEQTADEAADAATAFKEAGVAATEPPIIPAQLGKTVTESAPPTAPPHVAPVQPAKAAGVTSPAAVWDKMSVKQRVEIIHAAAPNKIGEWGKQAGRKWDNLPPEIKKVVASKGVTPPAKKVVPATSVGGTAPEPPPQTVQPLSAPAKGVKSTKGLKQPAKPPTAIVEPPGAVQPQTQARVPLWQKYAQGVPEQPAAPVAPKTTPTQVEAPVEGLTLPSGRKPPSKPPDPVMETVEQFGDRNWDAMKKSVAKEDVELSRQLMILDKKFRSKFIDRITLARDLDRAVPGAQVHARLQVVPGAVAEGEDIVRRFYLPAIQKLNKVGVWPFRKTVTDVPALQEYMTQMHNLDLLQVHPGTSLPGGVEGYAGTLANLKRLEKELGPERFGQVKKVADTLWDNNVKYVLKELLDEGIISPAAYQAMYTKYPHFISYKRQDFIGDLERTFAQAEGSVGSTGIKAMSEEGSTRSLSEALAHTMAAPIRVKQLIAQNRAGKETVAALQAYAKANNLDLGSAPKAGTISYFQDGKKVDVVVPKQWSDMAKGADYDPVNMTNKVLRATAQPLMKGAVTYNPWFLIKNPIRDAASAFWREKLTVFSPHYWNGWAAAFTKNELFSEAAQNGALMSGLIETMTGRDALSRVNRMGAITLQKPSDYLKLPFRLLEEANITAERATRLGVYSKLRAEGVDPLMRAVRSRDVTVDFAKMGTAMKAVNAAIPFANAGLQGTINTWQVVRNKPGWALLATAPLMTVTAISRVNNARFESSKLIPHYEYANYWVFQVGEFEKKNPYSDEMEKAPIYVKIPKGPIASQITFPGELLASYALENDDTTLLEHMGGFTREAWESAPEMLKLASPIDPSISGITPPLLGTGVQMAGNFDFYRGQNIIPAEEKDLPSAQQFGPNTSTASIGAGAVLSNLPGMKNSYLSSPRMLDFAVQDYLAGGGMTTAWLTSMALEGMANYRPKEGLEKEKVLVGPEKLSAVPGSLIGTKNTQPAQDYYKGLALAQEATGLSPDQTRQLSANLRKYHVVQAAAKKVRDEALITGGLTGKAWRMLRAKAAAEYAGALKFAGISYPLAAQVQDPALTKKFYDTLNTLAGTTPDKRTKEELLLGGWYAIDYQEDVSDDDGAWTKFFAEREAYRASLSPENRDVLDNALSEKMSRADKVYEQAKNILRPYWEIKDTVWANYSPESRQLSNKSDQFEKQGKQSESLAILRKHPEILQAQRQIALQQLKMKRADPRIDKVQKFFYR